MIGGKNYSSKSGERLITESSYYDCTYRTHVFCPSQKYNKKTEICESWYDKVKKYKIGENQTSCDGFYKDLDSKLRDYYEVSLS